MIRILFWPLTLLFSSLFSSSSFPLCSISRWSHVHLETWQSIPQALNPSIPLDEPYSSSSIPYLAIHWHTDKDKHTPDLTHALFHQHRHSAPLYQNSKNSLARALFFTSLILASLLISYRSISTYFLDGHTTPLHSITTIPPSLSLSLTHSLSYHCHCYRPIDCSSANCSYSQNKKKKTHDRTQESIAPSSHPSRPSHLIPPFVSHTLSYSTTLFSIDLVLALSF